MVGPDDTCAPPLAGSVQLDAAVHDLPAVAGPWKRDQRARVVRSGQFWSMVAAARPSAAAVWGEMHGRCCTARKQLNMGCRAASACVDATGVLKQYGSGMACAWRVLTCWYAAGTGCHCSSNRLRCVAAHWPKGSPWSGQGWCTKAEYDWNTCHQRSWQLIAVWELTLILLCFLHLVVPGRASELLSAAEAAQSGPPPAESARTGWPMTSRPSGVGWGPLPWLLSGGSPPRVLPGRAALRVHSRLPQLTHVQGGQLARPGPPQRRRPGFDVSVRLAGRPRTLVCT